MYRKYKMLGRRFKTVLATLGFGFPIMKEHLNTARAVRWEFPFVG